MHQRHILNPIAQSYLTNILFEQFNKLVGPFCNKGWLYYEQFQDIIPNASARGSYAFSPVNTDPPGQPDEAEDDAKEGLVGEGTSGQDVGQTQDAMDVDKSTTLHSSPMLP